jgi:hypothetical protein
MCLTRSRKLLFHDGQLMLKQSTLANKLFHNFYELVLLVTKLSLNRLLNQLDHYHLHTMLIHEVCPLIILCRTVEI